MALGGESGVVGPTKVAAVTIVRREPSGPPGARERLQAGVSEVGGDERARVVGAAAA